MSNRKHRVVVQLTDNGSDDDLYGSDVPILPHVALRGNKHVPGKNIKANVEVLDARSLLLSIKNGIAPNRMQEMHFDCVGTPTDLRTTAEISTLIDQLLVQCNNCSLLKFSPMKVSQVPVIYNQLINEIEKRIQLLKMTIHSIKIEYFDVQKYDMINLIADVTRKRRRPNVHNAFTNTLELHKWFQKEYIQLWSGSVGHDCLDVHFTFVDVRHHIHKVKLSLFNVYLNKMDNDTKNTLFDFLKNMGSDKPSKHCLLTDCLKEYIADHKSGRTWMLFDVPTLKKSGSITNDMLKLANAAYIGAHTSNKNSSDIGMIDSDVPVIDTQTINVSKNTNIGDGVNQHSRRYRNRAGSDESFSSKDFDSLSSWYCKVDEKFLSVMTAMETYYKCKYAIRISQICSDIKQLVRTVDRNQKVQDSETYKNTLAERELQASFAKYKASLVAFRNLAREIERCSYSELLKVYLKTKNYELAQEALHLKIQQLEVCQKRFTNAIIDEVDALNVLKKSTSKLDTVADVIENTRTS